jgi:hypothetical protein
MHVYKNVVVYVVYQMAIIIGKSMCVCCMAGYAVPLVSRLVRWLGLSS